MAIDYLGNDKQSYGCSVCPSIVAVLPKLDVYVGSDIRSYSYSVREFGKS